MNRNRDLASVSCRDEDVRWFDVETGVVIHTANAWDDGDEVVLQASRSNTADTAGAGTSEGNNLQENQGRLYEWRINSVTGDVSERALSGMSCDFTRINDDYACHKKVLSMPASSISSGP